MEFYHFLPIVFLRAKQKKRLLRGSFAKMRKVQTIYKLPQNNRPHDPIKPSRDYKRPIVRGRIILYLVENTALDNLRDVQFSRTA